VTGRLRQRAGLAILVLVAIAAALGRLLIDRPPDGGGVSLAWPEAAYATFRYTAVAAGAIVGVALAVSGTLLQALLRNPLASPFVLGLSSGAGLGVMVQLAIVHLAARDGRTSALIEWAQTPAGTTGAALIGALATLIVVYALSQRRGFLDPLTLLLIGVVVSTICGAGIMFCQHLVPTGVKGEFTVWLMGHIPEAVGAVPLAIVATLTLAGTVVATALGRAMDAATLGDSEARSVGLAVGPLRFGLFALAGALTAVAVALAGPIAFVGLIAPHAARLVLGPRHTPLVVGAALAGVGLVVGADVARQAIDVGGGRMPIGIFTALIGGPAFIWLLLGRRGAS
jgi:iron complex transport system permease protein